jgi:RNA polymerase sigma factor (sigma-70 family)
MSKDKDQPLITLTRTGDTAAYALLVEKYQHMVYTLALKLVGRPEDAQEVAQDAFLKAYQALNSFKGKSKFSTWLYKITYHKGLDLLKKRKRIVAADSIDRDFNINLPSLENTWDALEKKEQRETIKKAVAELHAADAIIITLFYFEELSLNEIAVVLSLTPNAVKVKVFRARKRLAHILRSKLDSEIIEGYEAHTVRFHN